MQKETKGKKKKPNRGWRKSAGYGKLYDVQSINFGWFNRRFGILLENLPPLKQRLIKENHYVRYLERDPQAVEIVFIIEDNLDYAKAHEKTYWNPYTDSFSNYRQLLKDSSLVDWQCAICDADIQCRTDSAGKVENFVCSDCAEAHNSSNRVVDRRIISSSRKLTSHVKKLLKQEQREFISYTKKSAKKQGPVE